MLNGVIENDFSFDDSKKKLGIAAAVFLGGVALKKIYKPYLRIGKKYHIEVVKLSE